MPKPTCSECGAEMECCAREVGGSDELEFISNCPQCGSQKTKRKPGGSGLSDKWHGFCPFCGEPANGHPALQTA